MARKMGRPSMATPELQDEILDRLIDGESLLKICEEPGMPNRSTVARWLAEDPALHARYLKAKDLMADHMADLVQATAEASTPETALADRVKIAAYQWRAAKLKPKVYGDKIQHTAGDGESPIQTTLNIQFISPRDRDPELADARTIDLLPHSGVRDGSE